MCRFWCGHKCSAPQRKYQGVRLLSVILECDCDWWSQYVEFWWKLETAKLSSEVAVPLCINVSCCSIFIGISKSHSFYLTPLDLTIWIFIACSYLILLFEPLWTYLEKAMAPHSSTLAWKIPWTEEPGRLQSVGLQRVRHNWVTSLSLFTFTYWRRKWQPTPVFLPGESQGRGSLVGRCLRDRTELDTTEAT